MSRKKDVNIYEEQVEAEALEEDGFDETYEDETYEEAGDGYEEDAGSGDSDDSESEGTDESGATEEDKDAVPDEKSARRIARRKRRVRNQVLAYITMLIFAALLICGGVIGGQKLFRMIGNGQRETTQEEQPTGEPDRIEIVPPDVTDTPAPEVGTLPVDEVALYYISQMTTEEKVAGLFFVTPESMMEGIDQAVVAGARTQEALDQYAVGGIIYFDRNIQSSSQLSEMLQKTREMSRYPIFLGVDEEGGTVARVANSLSAVGNTGDASELGAAGDPGVAYTSYSEIGNYLRELGFDVDFAPVADIYDGANEMFAKRSFGTDANLVATYVYQAVCGLQDSGISACVKHFPGHGSAVGDSHDGRATDESTEEELLAGSIVPFQMAIGAGPDFVMIGHISLPNVLADYTPATMYSDIATRILRNQLGYNGIIITDAMNMAAITDYYTSAEAAVNVINAGCDMILMPENFPEAYQGLLDAVNNGEIPLSRIEESLLRIYRVKCAGLTLADVTGGSGVSDEDSNVDEGDEGGENESD